MRRDLRMGINMRLFDHALMADVPVKVLDGDQTWRVLGAYVKPEMWISPPRVKKQPHDQRPVSTSRRTPLENANPSDGALSIDRENDLENDLSANIRHRRGW